MSVDSPLPKVFRAAKLQKMKIRRFKQQKQPNKTCVWLLPCKPWLDGSPSNSTLLISCFWPFRIHRLLSCNFEYISKTFNTFSYRIDLVYLTGVLTPLSHLHSVPLGFHTAIICFSIILRDFISPFLSHQCTF